MTDNTMNYTPLTKAHPAFLIHLLRSFSIHSFIGGILFSIFVFTSLPTHVTFEPHFSKLPKVSNDLCAKTWDNDLKKEATPPNVDEPLMFNIPEVCYAIRYPDLFKGFCNNDAFQCNLDALKEHFDNVGSSSGLIFGCAVANSNYTMYDSTCVLPATMECCSEAGFGAAYTSLVQTFIDTLSRGRTFCQRPPWYKMMYMGHSKIDGPSNFERDPHKAAVKMWNFIGAPLFGPPIPTHIQDGSKQWKLSDDYDENTSKFGSPLVYTNDFETKAPQKRLGIEEYLPGLNVKKNGGGFTELLEKYGDALNNRDHQELRQMIREFYFATPKPSLTHFEDESKATLAIHVRRGNIMEGHRRYISEESILHCFDQWRPQLPKDLEVHVYSNGRVKDFMKIATRFPEWYFHFDDSTVDTLITTFHHLVMADFLLSADSSFSRIAMFLKKHTTTLRQIDCRLH